MGYKINNTGQTNISAKAYVEDPDDPSRYDSDSDNVDLIVVADAPYVIATDTNSRAGGVRQSQTKLVMVNHGALTTRTADIDLIKQDYPLTSDYPSWAGTDVTGAAGNLTAKYDGINNSTVIATYDEGKDDSVQIQIVPQSTNLISIDLSEDGKVGAYIKKVNEILSKVSPGSKLSASGAVDFTVENVDYYNDGEQLGVKVTGGGELSATYKGEIEAEIPIPTGVPGITVEIEFEVEDPTLTGRLEGIYDESQADKGSVSGSLSLTASVSGGAGVQLGLSVAKVEVEDAVAANFGGTLTFIAKGGKLYMQGSAGLTDPAVKLEIKGKFRSKRKFYKKFTYSLSDDFEKTVATPETEIIDWSTM